MALPLIDVEAIYDAKTQPPIRFVPLKGIVQQSIFNTPPDQESVVWNRTENMEKCPLV